MWAGRFDPAEGVIWIDARVFGPMGQRNLDCILDTGTPRTILDTSILDSLGYGAGMGTRIASVHGVDGLIGMDLIAGRILTIDARTGTVTLGP